MKKTILKSYCKINLFLRVIKKLNTNYHKIQSLVTFCEPHDLIFVSRIQKKKDKIIFKGKFGKKIDAEMNTITKILKLIRKEGRLKNIFFKIYVKKNIPHGSGLGGGSTNAAELINHLNSKYNLKFSISKIQDIALKTGSDVNLGLIKKNSFITGKNNEILRLDNMFNLNLLIVFPNIICSTQNIYKQNKELSKPVSFIFESLSDRHKLIKYLKNEKNNLEKTVLKTYPKVKKLKATILKQKGCYFSRVTGSGSSCIGVFSSLKFASNAKKLIKNRFPNYWSFVSRTI